MLLPGSNEHNSYASGCGGFLKGFGGLIFFFSREHSNGKYHIPCMLADL